MVVLLSEKYEMKTPVSANAVESLTPSSAVVFRDDLEDTPLRSVLKTNMHAEHQHELASPDIFPPPKFNRTSSRLNTSHVVDA